MTEDLPPPVYGDEVASSSEVPRDDVLEVLLRINQAIQCASNDKFQNDWEGPWQTLGAMPDKN